MRKALLTALVLCPVSILFFAGCGGNGGDDSISPGPSTSATYFACVVNNGTSPSVKTYPVNATTGALGTAADSVDLTTGTAPQWVVAHPSLNVVYVTTADGEVHAYSIHATSGALTEIDHEATDAAAPTKVTITPNGHYLYVANESSAHSISIYSIAVDGSLTPRSPTLVMSLGHAPDEMVADPDNDYIYVLDRYYSGGPQLHAYDIGGLGTLTNAAGSPLSLTGSPRNLAVRLNNLYVNYNSSAVYQFTDQLVPLTPASATATGNGSSCAVVNDYFYRFVDSTNRIFGFSIAGGGTLTELAGPLSLGGVASYLTGGVDGKFLYSVYSATDKVGWSAINASTGALTAGLSIDVDDQPVCMTVIQTQ